MFKMQPNTEKEIDMLSVKSGVSNRSRRSQKKEDDLISVISKLSVGSKRSTGSKRPQSHDITKKNNLETAGKSVVQEDKPQSKDDLIERLSNISRKVSEANKSFLEKISKKDDDLQSIRSKHSQILNSSHMSKHKEKKDPDAKPKEKKVYTLKDIKKYSGSNRGGADDEDNRSVISGVSHKSGLTNLSYHSALTNQTVITTASTKEKMKVLEGQLEEERKQRHAIEEEVKSLKSFLSDLCKNIDEEPEEEKDEEKEEEEEQEQPLDE